MRMAINVGQFTVIQSTVKETNLCFTALGLSLMDFNFPSYIWQFSYNEEKNSENFVNTGKMFLGHSSLSEKWVALNFV